MIIIQDGSLIRCNECAATFPNHKWGKIRAHDAGWFMSKVLDTAFCPEHVPDWIKSWHARKQDKHTG